ncbi:pyridoxamine 5'-phosphate oxidase family protein [Streptomyces althioticus]|uniref:pyridoxamine 5'-phosphate oxidase family protein n=1 Tax=Streptomyces althioticus TaxID=83380 RepID=UPI00341402ED
MHAHLGDRLVVESPSTGVVRRDGEIIGLHHEDGTPPYDVRWSDTDDVTLVFPGPDAHVQHLETEADDTPSGTGTTGTVGDDTAVPRTSANPGDIGRRVAEERRRRGLSREETARRARISPQYLAYLEEQPSDPATATLFALAAALDTTAASLRGGGVDRPPGQGHALLHPRLNDLDQEECRRLLSTHGVGRVAVTAPDGRPAVVPVNYEVVDDAIVFRTRPGSVPAAAAGNEVAFEVDHVDEAMSQGWSVLAVGPATTVTDPDALRDLARRAHTEPWAGGTRDTWVSVRPTRLTGKRITPADQSARR